MNSVYAVALFWRVLPLRIIKYSAIPNRVYKISHAILNTHPFGVKTDCANPLYQSFTPGTIGEKNPPKIPGTNEITIAKTNVKNFFIISSLYITQYTTPPPTPPQERFPKTLQNKTAAIATVKFWHALGDCNSHIRLRSMGPFRLRLEPLGSHPRSCNKIKPPQSRRLNFGTPWGIRTLDLQIRNLMLYPAELRAQHHLFYTIIYKIQAPSPIRHKTISQQQPFSICAIQKTYKYLRTRTKSASPPDILPSQPHLPRERTSTSPPFPTI